MLCISSPSFSPFTSSGYISWSSCAIKPMSCFPNFLFKYVTGLRLSVVYLESRVSTVCLIL